LGGNLNKTFEGERKGVRERKKVGPVVLMNRLLLRAARRWFHWELLGPCRIHLTVVP
jgi:hypothetical protein